MTRSMIAILDLGSTQNARIAREVRALGVYSEIFAHDTDPAALKQVQGLAGIIVNGGENNIVDGEKIDVRPGVYELGLPVLTVAHEGAHPSDLPAWPDDSKPILDKFIASTGCERNWNMQNFIDAEVELLRRQIGSRKVLLALSGGVDSSVVAALLLKAVGDRLTCVHVNHGLLRKGEPEQVIRVFREQMGANLIYVDAVDRFLDKLAGVSDPEQKRKIIGNEFIEVFAEEARKLDGIEFLAQGTIWPDILESERGIKAHHNAGGLPEDMQFKLVEPVKILFKDEVRIVGKQLGLPDGMVFRQPFPGPGLGVRCPGAITRDRLEAVRESDAILREEFAKHGLEGKVWQYFTVVPDFKSTGVKNGQRAFEWSVIIRAVNTTDAMSATVENIPFDLMCHLVHRITHEVPGVNRVLYDFTPKPTGTIEFE